MECLARTFCALKKALDALDIYYQSLPQTELQQMKFPYITSFKVLNGTEIQFKYLKQLYETKLLFLVEQCNDNNADYTFFPQRLLVKFVRQYGIEAHQTCADLGIAPKLFGYENVLGGWKIIVMEFLEDGYELLTLHETTEVKNAVKEAVVKMHNAGFVHGDLRCENILYRKKQRIDDNNDQVDIAIVDFDWAGKVEQKTTIYPSFLNPEIMRHDDACAGHQILQEHDNYMVNLLF